MKTSSVLWEKLGDFLMDIGKYLLTAIAFGTFLSDKTDIWQWFVAVIIFAALIVAVGMLFIHLAQKNKDSNQITEIKKATFHIDQAEICNDSVK